MHISTMFQAKILKALILVLVLYFGIATMPSQAENILFSKDFNGKTITSIQIEVVPIFEGESLSVPYSTANSLKISTKTETITRDLLFDAFDRLDLFVMYLS